MISVSSTKGRAELYEFCESSGEEDSSEQESEKKTTKDGVEGFIVNACHPNPLVVTKESVHFSMKKTLLSIKGEVATPPPEVIA